MSNFFLQMLSPNIDTFVEAVDTETEVEADDSELADSGDPGRLIFFLFLGRPFNFGAEITKNNHQKFMFPILVPKKSQFYLNDCIGRDVLLIRHSQKFLYKKARKFFG